MGACQCKPGAVAQPLVQVSSLNFSLFRIESKCSSDLQNAVALIGFPQRMKRLSGMAWASWLLAALLLAGLVRAQGGDTVLTWFARFVPTHKILNSPCDPNPHYWTTRLEFSPDGSQLAIMSNVVRIVDFSSGKTLFQTQLGPSYSGIGWSPSGRLFLAVREDGYTGLWLMVFETRTWKKIQTMRVGSPSSYKFNVSWTRDERFFVISDSELAMVFRSSSGKRTFLLDGNTAGARASDPTRQVRHTLLGVTAGGQVLFVQSRQRSDGAFSDQVIAFDVSDDGRLERPRTLFDPDSGSYALLLLSPDGTKIASLSRDKYLRVFDAAGGQLLLTSSLENPLLEPPMKGGEPVAVFSPDSSVLAVGYTRDRMGLWDVLSGKLLTRLGPTKEGDFAAVAFNPSASKLVFNGNDQCQLEVWGSNDGSSLFTSAWLGTR